VIGVRAPYIDPLFQAAKKNLPGEFDAAQLMQLVYFLLERFEYVLEHRGFDVRNVRAITRGRTFADIRPSDELKKLAVLPEFADTREFQELAIAFKRVRNICKDHPDDDLLLAEATNAPIQVTLPAEKNLLDEIEKRRSTIEGAINVGDKYRDAFAEAARFKPAVDLFFKDVLVMDPDLKVRQNRLRLVRRLERLISRLANISEVVPEDAKQA
jgi:glycyl-tRNA synthetase beta chain